MIFFNHKLGSLVCAVILMAIVVQVSSCAKSQTDATNAEVLNAQVPTVPFEQPATTVNGAMIMPDSTIPGSPATPNP